MKYWKIAPGEGGFLWVEHSSNNCIAVGWNKIGDLDKFRDDESIKKRFKKIRDYSESSPRQLLKFYNEVKSGDKVVASGAKGIYGIGTIDGEYKFDETLHYKHSRPVAWEMKFWEPLNLDELQFPKTIREKLEKRTVRELEEKEWKKIFKTLSKIRHPFKNLDNFEGILCAPQTEQEVIILFSKLSRFLKMKIQSVSTRFPDALLRIKKGKRWVTKSAEFEIKSSGFKKHLEEYKRNPEKCHMIICWERDWEPKNLEVIELKEELLKII